jgi:hypothetical protein
MTGLKWSLAALALGAGASAGTVWLGHNTPAPA